MMREITFSPKRTLEALLYIAHRVKAPDLHEVLKLRYFADKLHMSAYGYTASGDDYEAMEFGPVANGAYEILKAARGDRQNPYIPRQYFELVHEALRVNGRTVYPLREADTDYLSSAELKFLDEAIAKWGNMPFDARTELSHDAAYKQAWAEAEQRGAGAHPIADKDIAATLDNADEVLEYIAA